MQRYLAPLLLLVAAQAFTAPVSFDVSAVQPGPVSVTRRGDLAVIQWRDADSQPWQADFNLDPARLLIGAIRSGGRIVIQDATPIYSCSTGKRRGGFDEFFDFPPSHPEGTRNFQGEFRLTEARAATKGDRVEITFDGFRMGIFTGAIRYVFFPGSRLIQQIAVASTHEADTAYFYDAGLGMSVPRDVRPGNNMDSEISYIDPEDNQRTEHPNASE